MRPASFAVAGLGLAIAAYLTAVHYTGGEAACFIAHGCTVVQRSDYASLAGVPVALLGLVGYLTVLAALRVDGEAGRTVATLTAMVGAGFSGWLTYVEIARLDAICAWCVASAACMVALAVLTAVRLIRVA